MSDNKILDAVKQLDAKNDNHWTAAGEPRLETVRMLASDASLTREQVNTAAPDFKRPKDEAPAPTPPAPQPSPTPSTPPPPPAPPATPPAPPVPTTGDQGNDQGDQGQGNDQGDQTPPAPPEAPVTPPPPPPPAEPDEAVRGEIGVAPTSTPIMGAASIPAGPIPGEDVDGNRTPQPAADQLHTDVAADGLPTAFDPIAIEGAKDMGLNAEMVSSKSGPDGEPNQQLAEGVTGRGVNNFNSEEDDIVDALASVAPSPNAPTGLGGPLALDSMEGVDTDGLTTPSDVTGETQLATLDRGHSGDPDAIPGLQTQLEEAQAKSEKLRAQADKITAALNEAATNESAIRAQIEVATPRTSMTEAVQGYFGAQDAVANKTLEARKLISDSGIDFKELERLTQRSPIDAAAKA